MIITFYSYKGGVGRSMAIANIATILACKYGRRVIVVDWDLEAPGLHRFFGIPLKEVSSGVIDFLYEYKELLAGDKEITMGDLPKVKDFITPIPINSCQKGKLWLMPAGKQDPFYADRVNYFDWVNFYEEWNGGLFIEYMKRELRDIADYIIVDSRTGFTDIGGICTLQLPDAVVALYASNWQNVDGVEQLILNTRENTIVKKMKKNITIIPVPARIEVYLEYDRTIEWKQIFKEKFSEYLPDYIDIDTDTFFNNVAIPYIAKFSYGEEIAVERPEEDGSNPMSISHAYYKLAEYIIEISIEYFKKEIEDKYLFSWDNVPGNDSERLLKTLRDDIDITWAEKAEIRKSDDGKTLRISKSENSAEILIDEEKEKATLKISGGRTHNLKVKKENSKLNIYEDGKRNKIEIAQIYRNFGSLEQFRGNNDTALNCYNKALEIFEELKEKEGYKPDKQVMVYIISNTAKLYMDKAGLMNTTTLGRYAQAFKIYDELNDKTGALQTFNDISPDPDDTVDNLSDCIKTKPYLRDEAANILCVVSKFNPDLVLPTLNHLADSVVPAVQDKALDILEQVVKVKPEDAEPILKRLIKFSWITSIRDRAKSMLDETSSQ